MLAWIFSQVYVSSLGSREKVFLISYYLRTFILLREVAIAVTALSYGHKPP